MRPSGHCTVEYFNVKKVGTIPYHTERMISRAGAQRLNLLTRSWNCEWDRSALQSCVTVEYNIKNACDMREPSSTFATACIATWDVTCIATMETQVASWALAYDVCFPLVSLDLRQNSINRPSLWHVATTCRVSHVATCRVSHVAEISS